MAKRGTKARGMTPLQALVLSRMQEKQWDARTVESRGVTHATLHRYMNPVQLRQLPRQAVLEGLAKALQLDVEVVRQAAKDSVGTAPEREVGVAKYGPFSVDVDDGLVAHILIERIDRLPVSDLDVERGIAAVRRAMAKQAPAGETSSRPAEDYDLAAREGVPLQVQIDAAEPDPNVDPEGPEGGA